MLMWEKRSVPEYGGRAQAFLNKQLVDRSDIVVVLFWVRFGSNTGVAESGTVEEIDRAVAAGKVVMIYFSEIPVAPTSIDLSQLAKLREFKAETYEKALVGRFTSHDDLKRVLDRDILERIRVMKVPAAEGGTFDIKGGTVLPNAVDVNSFRQPASAPILGLNLKLPDVNRGRDAREAARSIFKERFIGNTFNKIRHVNVVAMSILPVEPIRAALNLRDIEQADILCPMASSRHRQHLSDKALLSLDGYVSAGKRTGVNTAVELTVEGELYAVAGFEAILGGHDETWIPLDGIQRDVDQHIAEYVTVLRRVGVAGILEVKMYITGTSGKYVAQRTETVPPNFRKLIASHMSLPLVTFDSDVDGTSVSQIAQATGIAFVDVWRDGGFDYPPITISR